jgi:hypothetical protein
MSHKNSAEKLIEKLSSGIVLFTYRKQNGEIRYAAGTTNEEVIPLECKSRNVAMANVKDNIRYYDYMSIGWRSLKKDNIVRIMSSVKK